MELPTHNLNNAQTIQQSYDRSAYLREVLDAMHARKVLVKVSPDQARGFDSCDNRFSPMLTIDCSQFFAEGRYGVNYEEKAGELSALLSSCGARDLCALHADARILRFALIPVSEDTGCVLHIHAKDEEQLCWMAEMLDKYPTARALISCEPEDEILLIELSRTMNNILPRIGKAENIRCALSKLGTRFIPYASCAVLPEQMLGRWSLARETIWQTLLDAYLPLARSGYELTSDAVNRDVDHLLGGNLESFYREIY